MSRFHCTSVLWLSAALLATAAHAASGDAPVARGLMTTVHAATATQKTVDGTSNKD